MTTLRKEGDHSLLVTIADEGTSLSVQFSQVKFPNLFGWDAYTHPRYDEPRWVYVQDEPDRAKFTERLGRFAPFKKVHVREREPHTRDEDRSLDFRFDNGLPYNRRFRVQT